MAKMSTPATGAFSLCHDHSDGSTSVDEDENEDDGTGNRPIRGKICKRTKYDDDETYSINYRSAQAMADLFDGTLITPYGDIAKGKGGSIGLRFQCHIKHQFT